jgi:hypothetical protein
VEIGWHNKDCVRLFDERYVKYYGSRGKTREVSVGRNVKVLELMKGICNE